MAEHHQDLDDLIFGDPAAVTHGMSRAQAKARRRNNQRKAVSLVIACGLLFGGSYLAYAQVKPVLESLTASDVAEVNDFEGEGTTEVTVVIKEGQSGSSIGATLVKAGVVKSVSAFVSALRANPAGDELKPGTFVLRKEMSARSAVELLLDPSSRRVKRVTIPEGLWPSEAFAKLSKETGQPLSAYKALKPEDFGVPAENGGRWEGYLFPETYEFGPKETAKQQVRRMVDQGREARKALGVTPEEEHRVLTIASIIEGEAMTEVDRPKVARVILNRLEQGMPLGMDSTIHYIAGERGKAGTTDSQRDADSPYNTYKNRGLPPGPINSPGKAAIDAALNPTSGNWLYFVTVDPSSGLTLFTDTYSEHLENEKRFQEWCRANDDKC